MLTVAKRITSMVIVPFLAVAFNCSKTPPAETATSEVGENVFPQELVDFTPYEKNPVFAGTGTRTWDEKIRERGYILREDDGYHLWYTGYSLQSDEPVMQLGYATSPDGISWTRYSGNPIFTDSWVEDMMVVKHDSLYYMFAEGRNDIAHLLTSSDKVHWNDHGSLRIRQTNGEPLSPGPYGTPTVFMQDDIWHLFYERNDEGIWHATSNDLIAWKNVQDAPVIRKGPQPYDKFGVAMNQIIRHEEHYYAYYHGTPTEDWSVWNTNVAISKDLMQWEKYSGNPLIEENKSSGILVHDGKGYRLYTMHDQVHLHFATRKQ